MRSAAEGGGIQRDCRGALGSPPSRADAAPAPSASVCPGFVALGADRRDRKSSACRPTCAGGFRDVPLACAARLSRSATGPERRHGRRRGAAGGRPAGRSGGHADGARADPARPVSAEAHPHVLAWLVRLVQLLLPVAAVEVDVPVAVGGERVGVVLVLDRAGSAWRVGLGPVAASSRSLTVAGGSGAGLLGAGIER